MVNTSLNILIDFDGTCIPMIPEDGYCEYDTGAAKVLKLLKQSGHKLILWTCRNNSRNNPFNYINGKFKTETSLEEAERWFIENEIELDGVNEVEGEEDIVGYSRKALGDILIDDTALGVPLIEGDIDYYSKTTESMVKNYHTYCVDWVKVEEILVNSGVITVF